MTKKIIIANWKMNPQTADEALRFVQGILAQRLPENIELLIAPPFIYLDLLKKNCGKEIKLAAQNISWAERGAYTGEISGSMLKNIGCGHVIIGHSERRYIMGETEEIINLKLKAALKIGLTPILAIGEKEQNDDISKILSQQIESALEGVDVSEINRLIIAYEPVWAISTSGNFGTGTPDHALSAALLIRKIISRLYGSEWASDLPVLYGGSVSEENAADFIAQKGIDGALVGGASLELQSFMKIIKAAGKDDPDIQLGYSSRVK
ncbi:MAG: triose-phosphate isomerase [Candidatus Azambacteria bacterium]|nr:triose-phosphate isomerase [Candidatus Azambacteria bacterium]